MRLSIIKTIGRKLKRPTDLHRQSLEAMSRAKLATRGRGVTSAPSAAVERDLAQIAREAGL